MAMHVISRRRLKEFWEEHPEAERGLVRWYNVVRRATWTSFADVRATFGSTDQYRRCLIFNVGGNKYRVIAAVHYNRRKIFIRSVLTHADYDAGTWRTDCEEG